MLTRLLGYSPHANVEAGNLPLRQNIGESNISMKVNVNYDERDMAENTSRTCTETKLYLELFMSVIKQYIYVYIYIYIYLCVCVCDYINYLKFLNIST